MKKILLVLLSIIILLPNLNVGKVSANYDNLTSTQLKQYDYIMNPVSQFVTASMCVSPDSKNNYTSTFKDAVTLTTMSNYVWYNGSLIGEVTDRQGNKFSSSFTAPTKLLEVINKTKTRLFDSGISRGKNCEDCESFLRPSLVFTSSDALKSNKYFNYNLLNNKETINIKNGLYPIYSVLSYNIFAIEKVFFVSADNFDKLKVNGNKELSMLSIEYNNKFDDEDAYLSVIKDHTKIKLWNNLETTTNALSLTSTIGEKTNSDYYGVSLTTSKIDEVNLFNKFLTNDIFKKISVENYLPEHKKIFDITDQTRPEYSLYKYSFDYGSFSGKYSDIDTQYKKDKSLYGNINLNNTTTVDNLKSYKCNSGDMFFLLYTVKGAFIDRKYSPYDVEPIVVDLKDVEEPTIEEFLEDINPGDPKPKDKIVVRPDDVSDTDSDSPEDKINGETSTDLIDQNLQVNKGVNIKINNIPENGKVISGDSYFVPSITVSNDGYASNLQIDSNTIKSEDYLITQWDDYGKTNLNTDIVLIKLDKELSDLDTSSIKFDSDNSIEGTTQLSRLNGISKLSDFSNLTIKEAGNYIVSVKSTDKKDSNKSSVIHKQFNVSFNDNIGYLPVRNNLNFNINDISVNYNKKKTSLGISKPIYSGYNSLKIPSVTNGKGETLISNGNGDLILFDTNLKTLFTSNLGKGVNSITQYNSGFLLATSDGLYHLNSDTLELKQIESTTLTGNVSSIKNENSYLISVNSNELSLVNLKEEGTSTIAEKGVTYSHSEELSDFEDLGKLLVVTNKDNGKITVLSKTKRK